MNREEMLKRLKAGEDPLELSIQKWRDIVAGTGKNESPSNCALCEVHQDEPDGGSDDEYDDDYDNDDDDDDTFCNNCPVFQKTGKTGCNGTPYDDYFSHLPNAVELARKELAFLESLRPTKEASQ